jgi:hypothetical protein
VDTDPDWTMIELGPWIRIQIQKGKMTHKHREKFKISFFEVLGCSLLRDEGFSFSLGVLLRRPKDKKIAILDQKRFEKI